MDEFAQTGAQQDDLFDEIQYAPGTEESMQTRAPDELFGEEFTPVDEPVVEQPQSESQPAQAPQAAPRGRGRGGRGGGTGRGRGREGPKSREPAPRSTEKPAAPAPTATDTTEPAAAPGPLSDSKHSTAPLSESRHSTAPPTEPRHANAARGDRRATGGLQKAKLSPAELEAKMKSMSLRSAELTQRHQRAEADRASFDKREEVAKEVAQKRSKEERRDRQQMMGEREKNRMRKLKAMEGREWDAEKQEEDYNPRANRGGYSRGAHGGVVGQREPAGAAGPGFGKDQEDYTDGREYLYREPRGRGRGRGSGPSRGGREGRGGQQNAPKHSDFPELPAATTPSAETEEAVSAPALSFPKKATEAKDDGPAPAQADSPPPTQLEIPTPGEKGKSWADMVESAT